MEQKSTPSPKNMAADIKLLVRKYLAKWYWFAISAFVCFAAAFLYVKFAAPIYKVQTSILIRQDQGNFNFSQMAVFEKQRLDFSKVIEDELEIVKSKTLIGRAIDELGIETEIAVKTKLSFLDAYPEKPLVLTLPENFIDTLSRAVEITLKPKGNGCIATVKYDRTKQKRQIETWGQSIETVVGKITIGKGANFDEKNPHSYRIRITPVQLLADDYRKAISVTQVSRKTNAIIISTSNTNTHKAIDLLNTMVRLYNEDADNDKNDIADNSRRFLEERIYVVQNELDSVESRLERFRIVNKVNDVPMETSIYLQRQSDYERLVSYNQIQIGQAETILKSVKDDKNKYKPIPFVQLNIMSSGTERYNETGDNSINILIKDYNALLIQYETASGEARRTLEQQIALQRANVLTSLESLKDGLEISLKDLTAKKLEAEKKLGVLPAQERSYLEIKRQQETKQELYLYLLQKYEESSLAIASQLPTAKTLDKAYALPKPESPKTMITLALALILGLTIPAAVMYFIDIFKE